MSLFNSFLFSYIQNVYFQQNVIRNGYYNSVFYVAFFFILIFCLVFLVSENTFIASSSAGGGKQQRQQPLRRERRRRGFAFVSVEEKEHRKCLFIYFLSIENYVSSILALM